MSQTQPINHPEYWTKRFHQVVDCELPVHHRVFKCPSDKWNAIRRRHLEILKSYVKPGMSILDIGCGWGRLLTMMPQCWKHSPSTIEKQPTYTGFDLCPEFIVEAKRVYTERFGDVSVEFNCGDFMQDTTLNYLATVKSPQPAFDLAIMVSFRPMIIRNLGQEQWNKMAELIKLVSNRQLYLEYDENCDGFIECSLDDH